MDDLKIAVVCMHAEPGEVERNLASIRSFVQKASFHGADIICLPELAVTGYILNNPYGAYGGDGSRKATDSLMLIAREENIVIIVGLIEIPEGGRPYITQLVIGPAGILGFHRKSHLSPHEKEIYGAGDEIGLFPYKNTLFGIQLCYEAHFPEISTAMALKGADIIFIPHASPRGDPYSKMQSWLRHLRARAFDNALFIVACNQVGKNSQGFLFPGVALILGPDGLELASYVGKKEKIIFVDLKSKALKDIRRHRMKYFLPNRRPELYGDLLSVGHGKGTKDDLS